MADPDRPEDTEPEPDDVPEGTEDDRDEPAEPGPDEDFEDEEPEPEARPRRPPRPPGAPEAGFVERAWEAQHTLEARFQRVGRGRYTRVLKMARKPEPEEFRRASQITAIGIAVIGFLGFVILLLMDWLMGTLGIR